MTLIYTLHSLEKVKKHIENDIKSQVDVEFDLLLNYLLSLTVKDQKAAEEERQKSPPKETTLLNECLGDVVDLCNDTEKLQPALKDL